MMPAARVARGRSPAIRSARPSTPSTRIPPSTAWPSSRIEQRSGRLDPADRIGHGQNRGIDGSLLRRGTVRPQEANREPAPGQQVGGDLAVLVGAARNPVALEHQHGRDPNGDRQQNQPGGQAATSVHDHATPFAPKSAKPGNDRRLPVARKERSSTGRSILGKPADPVNPEVPCLQHPQQNAQGGAHQLGGWRLRGCRWYPDRPALGHRIRDPAAGHAWRRRLRFPGDHRYGQPGSSPPCRFGWFSFRPVMRPERPPHAFTARVDSTARTQRALGRDQSDETPRRGPGTAGGIPSVRLQRLPDGRCAG